MKEKLKERKSLIKWAVLAVIIILVVLAWPRKPDYEDPKLARPVLGDPSATVTVVEFGDLQCPACGAAHPVTKRIQEEYAGKIRYEFKHYPLNIHLFAQKAAEAAECAHDQGMFWEYVDVAYKNQNALQIKKLKEYASVLGLDTALFNACLDSGAKTLQVKQDIAAGNQKGVQGTPTFFINGQRLESWDYTRFSAAIDAALSNG